MAATRAAFFIRAWVCGLGFRSGLMLRFSGMGLCFLLRPVGSFQIGLFGDFLLMSRRFLSGPLMITSLLVLLMALLVLLGLGAALLVGLLVKGRDEVLEGSY